MITKGQEETSGGDELVHYLVCGDGFTGYTFANIHPIISFKYAYICICLLYITIPQ